MDKDLAYYMDLPYPIVLIHDDEAGWYVGIPLLPGCMSQADTPNEAVEMIRDAMAGWIAIALEDGIAIQEPQDN